MQISAYGSSVLIKIFSKKYSMDFWQLEWRSAVNNQWQYTLVLSEYTLLTVSTWFF